MMAATLKQERTCAQNHWRRFSRRWRVPFDQGTRHCPFGEFAIQGPLHRFTIIPGDVLLSRRRRLLRDWPGSVVSAGKEIIGQH